MQELLIKDAPLIIPYGKKKYLFIIKQASLSEILEFDFYLQKDKEIVKHILSLLKKLNPDFTNNVFNKISPEGFSQIHNFFLKNYCTGFYELKKDKKQAEIKKSSVDIEKVPFSSIIA
ncbi:hypothetical protein KAU11_07700 [Candidatus Babeliales bacterium]|nr:hypothetical protein [Candidatus Babeliales bacterium]